MPPEVVRALETIGLKGKELQVFLALLRGGTMYAAALAKTTRINRTTVYGLLKELEDRGLVSSATKSGTTKFQSIAPELLPAYIERRAEELVTSRREVARALPMIQQLRNKAARIPRVQYFEGRGGVEQAYEDMLEHNEERKVFALTGLEGIVNNLDPKFVEYFIKKRVSLGITADYIVPDTPVARAATQDDDQKGRKARFIPGKYNFNTEICMYADKVGIYSYALENPVALIIEDETIAHAMKQLFAFIESKSSI